MFETGRGGGGGVLGVDIMVSTFILLCKKARNIFSWIHFWVNFLCNERSLCLFFQPYIAQIQFKHISFWLALSMLDSFDTTATTHTQTHTSLWPLSDPNAFHMHRIYYKTHCCCFSFVCVLCCLCVTWIQRIASLTFHPGKIITSLLFCISLLKHSSVFQSNQFVEYHWNYTHA